MKAEEPLTTARITGTFILLFVLLPFLWDISTSLKQETDIISSTIHYLPHFPILGLHGDIRRPMRAGFVWSEEGG